MHWGSYVAAPIDLKDSRKLLSKLIPNICVPIQASPADYLHMTLSYIGWIDEKSAFELARRINGLAFPKTIETTGRLISLNSGKESAYLAVELVLTPELKRHHEKYLHAIHGNAEYFGDSWLPHISIGRIPASESVCLTSPLIPSSICLNDPCLFKSMDRSERITTDEQK